MGIIRITAGELQAAFPSVSETAEREPVAITRPGRDDLILMSSAEYARLTHADRKVHAASELPDELLEAAERSRMDARHAHLDAELDPRER